MSQIREILKKNELKAHRYTKKGNATIVDTDNGRFVLKIRKRDNNELLNYLKSRNFNYFPKIIDNDLEYEISEHIEEITTPKEQKLLDLIHLISLLHNKTTHYKEVDIDKFKEIYENLQQQINYLYNYYSDINTIIDSKVYMSPAEYLLVRNITKIYSALAFCGQQLEEWYELVKNKKKQRIVVLHNNLELDHFLKNENSYFISWDKANRGIPIYDFYHFYKKHCLEYDFTDLLFLYEKGYPLLDEERKLLFILLSLPDKLEFNDENFSVCKTISKTLDYLYKTENIILAYHTPKTKAEPKHGTE